MDLYLIRHGETVDNVAGLYAGVRDSQLTNYGVDQTKRLGEHFAKRLVLTHIFASPLSRALRTAQAIQSAQLKALSEQQPVEVVQVQELIEQNFGFYEGKSFQARTDPKKTGREAHRMQHKDDPGFVDVESKEAMNKRADTFLDEHLIPLFLQKDEKSRLRVAVVSHGMLLSHLWRRLLLRLPPKSVSVDSAVTAVRSPIVLQHLGGWSNTGYLELDISQAEAPAQSQGDAIVAQPRIDSTTAGLRALSRDAIHDAEEEEDPASGRASHLKQSPKADHPAPAPKPVVDQSSTVLHLPAGLVTVILAIDRKDHLAGLKRQRGGIGRSAHDDKQGKLESFFKKQRTS